MTASTLLGRFTTAPRPTGTSADPPRGRGPAWERPGARPASGSMQLVSLERLCAKGVHPAAAEERAFLRARQHRPGARDQRAVAAATARAAITETIAAR